MQKKVTHILLLFVSIILFALVGYSLFVEYREKPYDDYLLTVSVRVDNKEMTIYPYQKYNNYYFLLPSYAQFSDTYIVENKKHDIYLNDIELESKNHISEFEANTSYTILDNDKDMGTLIIMYGSYIPTVFIETDSRNIDNLKNNQYLEESASLVVIDDGHINYNSSIEYISGRGNFSWGLEKKGWSIKLLEDAPLLGMKSYDQWVLTSNMYDDTMGLRNYAAYSMAKQIGMDGTSDFRFVDLYINNEYQGTYMLFEKIGCGEDKLNIGDLDLLNDKSNKTIELSKLKPIQEFNISNDYPDKSYREFNSPNDITGGYIIERNILNKTYGKEHLFTTSSKETYVVRYPSYVNKEEIDYIGDIVENIERAIHSDDYIDPITNKNLNELMDIDSYVLKYLVDEVSKNEGAAATSSYFYKKQGDDLLYSGPIWDYDKSFGRFDDWAIPEGLSNGLLYKSSAKSDWYDRLYNNEEVFSLIRKYYKDRIKPYLNELCEGLIDEQAKKIRSSFDMNSVLWSEEFFKKDYRLPYDLIEHVGDFDYSINYLKDWIRLREAYLDKEWRINE